MLGKLGTEQAEGADLERQISIRLERGVFRGVWSLTGGIRGESVNGQRVAGCMSRRCSRRRKTTVL